MPARCQYPLYRASIVLLVALAVSSLPACRRNRQAAARFDSVAWARQRVPADVTRIRFMAAGMPAEIDPLGRFASCPGAELAGVISASGESGGQHWSLILVKGVPRSAASCESLRRFEWIADDEAQKLEGAGQARPTPAAPSAPAGATKRLLERLSADGLHSWSVEQLERDGSKVVHIGQGRLADEATTSEELYEVADAERAKQLAVELEQDPPLVPGSRQLVTRGNTVQVTERVTFEQLREQEREFQRAKQRDSVGL